MRDHEALRVRLAIALAMGLGACDSNEGEGSGSPKAAPNAGEAEREGDLPKTNADDDAGAGHSVDKGGLGTVVAEIRADADAKGTNREQSGESSSADSSGPKVDPVVHCRSPRLTVTVEDADANRFVQSDVLGCAESTSPVGVSGMANFTLDTTKTQALRDAGDTEHCCYRIVRPPRGRPLMASGRLVLPGFEVGPPRRRASVGEPSTARRVAAAWLHDARLEWASVTSFERAARELAELGAPRSLCAQYRRAADDERRHTRDCVRLAEWASGRVIRLMSLPPVAPRRGTLLDCMQRTFSEGCVAETAAVLVAARSARWAKGNIASILRTIADDEASHAALAWTTLGWGLARSTSTEREAWIRWARRQRPVTAVFGSDPDAYYGRLSASSERAIAAGAWDRCIVPLLDDLARALPSEPRRAVTRA